MAATEEGQFKTIDDKIDEKLLQNRRVFLSDPIDSNSAKEVIKRLWYLEFSDPGKPILLVINCPGGSVDAGFAIWDQIKMLTSPIVTMVTGMAASMGSVLSLVAPKGKRFATPNSRIMIHQPSIHGVVQGQATDLNIHAEEILKTRDSLVKLYVDVTGKDTATIEKAIDRDKWFSAKEAMEYGLIDKIVSSYEDVS